LHVNNFTRADTSFATGAKFTYINDALNQRNKLDYFEECRHYFTIALPSEFLCKRTEKFLRKLGTNCG